MGEVYQRRWETQEYNPYRSDAVRQVQLNDDGQLATLVSEAEAGESITILRGERPVAQIIPFPFAPKAMTSERAAAIARFKAFMDRGIDLGGFRIEDRDALYDRD